MGPTRDLLSSEIPDVRQTLGFTMEEAAVIDTPIAGLRGWAWLGMAGHGCAPLGRWAKQPVTSLCSRCTRIRWRLNEHQAIGSRQLRRGGETSAVGAVEMMENHTTILVLASVEPRFQCDASKDGSADWLRWANLAEQQMSSLRKDVEGGQNETEVRSPKVHWSGCNSGLWDARFCI